MDDVNSMLTMMSALSQSDDGDGPLLLALKLSRAVAEANPNIWDPSKQRMPLKNPEVTMEIRAAMHEAKTDVAQLKEEGILVGEGDKSLRISAKAVVDGLKAIKHLEFYAAPLESNNALRGKLEELGIIHGTGAERSYDLPKLYAWSQAHERGVAVGAV